MCLGASKPCQSPGGLALLACLLKHKALSSPLSEETADNTRSWRSCGSSPKPTILTRASMPIPVTQRPGPAAGAQASCLGSLERFKAVKPPLRPAAGGSDRGERRAGRGGRSPTPPRPSRL